MAPHRENNVSLRVYLNLLSISGASLALCVLVRTARAEQDVVVERLTEYGGLSAVQARSLRSVISKRMARAKREGDGVRVAVERAIAGSQAGSDRASSAELEKRLRAGLDRWALEKLFAPGPSALVTCGQKFRLSSGRCDALLAAAGEVPLARVAALSSASAPAAHSEQPVVQPEPTPRVERRATAMQISTVVPQPLSAESAAALDAQPFQIDHARKTQLPEPMPPAVARSKAEYDRQRASYWARRRQELDARLVQIRSSGGGQHVQRGPASELERQVVGFSPAASGKPGVEVATKPDRQPIRMAHDAPSKDEPNAETAALIDGLTADPLGKQAP
jgi:hypothetical protein